MYRLKIDIVIVYIVLIVVDSIDTLSQVLKTLTIYQIHTCTSDGLLQKDCESSDRQWWIISQQVLIIQW